MRDLIESSAGEEVGEVIDPRLDSIPADAVILKFSIERSEIERRFTD